LRPGPIFRSAKKQTLALQANKSSVNAAAPAQLGVRDVAFPVLNSVSFWLTATGGLVQEPGAPLGFVDPILQQACSGNITNVVRFTRPPFGTLMPQSGRRPQHH
jgi:hypothetical protein